MDSNDVQSNPKNESNTRQVNNLSLQDANNTCPVNLKKENLGYDPQTFGTTGTENTYGIYDSANTGNGTGPSPFEQEVDKKVKSGLIIGIIAIVLNLIFSCIPLISDWYFSPGWVLIFLESVGIQNAIQGKQSVNKRGMATAGMVLNIVAMVWSILLIVLVLVLKFADIVN